MPAIFSPGALAGVIVGLWLLFGAVMLADIVLSSRGERSVSMSHPPEIFVGETAGIDLAVTGVPAGTSVRLEWPEGISGPHEVTLSADADRPNATKTVDVRAVRRGAWRFTSLWLKWRSRLGLFEMVPRLTLNLTLHVVPNIRLIESGELTTTVASSLFGIKENRALGEGSEFHQLRDFVRGMDVKTIDWKRSAKRRALVAKELRAERNHQVIVALDNGYLMREEIAGLPRIDRAVTAALATAWAGIIGGDLVGFYSFDTRPNHFIAPTAGRQAFARIRRQSADLAYVTRETNHTLALTELNARTPKRSLIVIFTEFVDTTSAELMIENIGLLARRHLILFVTIRDPKLETVLSEASENTAGAARVVAAAQYIRERRHVQERLTRLGVTVIDSDPGALTSDVISKYLEIKARELV